jgi:FkbM family methyltransferase
MLRAARQLWQKCSDDLRRAWHERRGSDKYSRPALHGLDRKLEQYLDFDGGYFVEAGANDGFTQSNTYYFERLRGWRGLLIEAHPGLCARCRRRRPNAVTIHAALVDANYTQPTIALHEAGLMSLVDGAQPPAAVAAHLERAKDFEQPVTGRTITVPALTLDAVLAAANAPHAFDLLSLDVEGFEPAVLRGLDLHTWQPRFICIEARDRPVIDALLAPRYEAIAVLHRENDYEDILFRRR